MRTAGIGFNYFYSPYHIPSVQNSDPDTVVEV
jgi:hypothetical protein